MSAPTPEREPGMSAARRVTCPGSGQRTRRPLSYSSDEPDRCPVCDRVAYVRLDGTTGVHYR